MFSHLVEAGHKSRSLTAHDFLNWMDACQTRLYCVNVLKNIDQWSFNTLAPDLTNRSRWSPLRYSAKLLVGSFLRVVPRSGSSFRLFGITFLGIQVIRSIPSVWCSGSNCHLIPKQCIFFNSWLPTFVNGLKYGNLWLPVFVQPYYYCVYVLQCQSRYWLVEVFPFYFLDLNSF